jgi:hypothetical protein
MKDSHVEERLLVADVARAPAKWFVSGHAFNRAEANSLPVLPSGSAP